MPVGRVITFFRFPIACNRYGARRRANETSSCCCFIFFSIIEHDDGFCIWLRTFGSSIAFYFLSTNSNFFFLYRFYVSVDNFQLQPFDRIIRRARIRYSQERLNWLSTVRTDSRYFVLSHYTPALEILCHNLFQKTCLWSLKVLKRFGFQYLSSCFASDII